MPTRATQCRSSRDTSYANPGARMRPKPKRGPHQKARRPESQAAHHHAMPARTRPLTHDACKPTPSSPPSMPLSPIPPQQVSPEQERRALKPHTTRSWPTMTTLPQHASIWAQAPASRSPRDRRHPQRTHPQRSPVHLPLLVGRITKASEEGTNSRSPRPRTQSLKTPQEAAHPVSAPT